nr:YdcF family protein [Lachnospiraceae bacterium]
MPVMIKILRTLLGTAGIILFLWFFVPGLLTAHFHIGVVTGTIISILMIIYAVFAGQINRFISFLWSKAAGKVLIFIVLAAVAAILTLAIMCMVCMGRGMKKDAERSGTVVVLGCRVYSYGPSLMLRARLDEAIEYLDEVPGSVCIVCGGQGKNEPETEAAAMYGYLTERGVGPSRIYTDDTSQDTFENLTNASKIIEENGLDEKCVIVTSDYHCYRALKYAERFGYRDPSALPAKTLWWLFPSSYIREMYGILEMWFLN